MRTVFTLVGLLLGGVVAFLLRPAAPLVGQLRFETVLSRGAHLEGIQVLLKPIAERSFNYLIAGLTLGAVVGFAVAHLAAGGSRAAQGGR